MEVARTTLEMFPVSGAAPAAAIAVPGWNEVAPVIQGLLPSPSEVFNDSFFKNPLFPVMTLHDVAAFYGCPAVEIAMVDALGLSSGDRENRNIKIHIWLADFMECNKDTIINVVETYKIHRGSPDLQRRLSGTPSGPEARTERFDASANHDRTQGGGRLSHLASAIDRHAPENRRDGSFPSTQREGDRNHGPPLRPHSETGYQDSNDSRKAKNVFQYFKDSKFNGDISQSIELTIRDYNVCARQYKLSPKQKADFFVNLLADPAHTFFFNNACDDMTFDEMAGMMISEYNSDARQLQVQGMLETLRLDKYMSEHDISSHYEGLSKVIESIERLTPQCQPQFRSDANKINYLRKAVLGFNWSLIPIGNIITAKYSFNSFVIALREHLQLENEAKMPNPSAPSKLHTPADGTFHQQYGGHPRNVRKHGSSKPYQGTRPQSSKSSFEDSRRKRVCHRCQQKWRPGHRCQPGAVRNYARNRFKNGDSAVHIVSDLVYSLEGEADTNAEEDSTPSADSPRRRRSTTATRRESYLFSMS